MKKLIFVSICVIFIGITYLILTGEFSKYEGALTKEEVLELNPDADYFELDGDVYISVEWAGELTLTEDEIVTEIKEGMANKLPIGTIIYSAKERGGVLIAKYNGQEKRYIPALGE